MEYPLSEIIDRLSILILKQERSSNENQLLHYECSKFRGAMLEFQEGRSREWLEEIYVVNSKIWNLEADIRQGQEDKLSLSEIGRRALAIRNLNAERIRIKNTIAAAMGEFQEAKIDHVSAKEERLTEE